MPTARSSKYPVGVRNITATQTIPRERLTMHTGVGPPYAATGYALPAGSVFGEDKFGTVLRFSPTVTDALFQTEDYNRGHVGATWNNDNLSGDTTLKANLCGSIYDLTIDGRAEFRNYPYGYIDVNPDFHGPDLPFRADGIQVQGSGFNGSRLRLYQIPGAAIRLKGGDGAQAGPYGIYDEVNHRLDDIWITQAQYGVIVESTDTKLTNLIIGGIVNDGLTLGNSTVVTGAHVAGADRGTVFTGSDAMVSNLYSEAARIGTHITGPADGCRIHNLHIGPGTCWYRGLLIEASGCEVFGIGGKVAAPSVDHPENTGVEIATGVVHSHIAGQLVASGDGCTLFKIAGNRNKIGPLRGGWNGIAPDFSFPNCTFLTATETFTGCDIEIVATCQGGIGLDLSATNLNSVNGLGNRIRVNMGGTLTHNIKYPGGGYTYNLAAGTEIYWNGTLLS